MQSRPSVSCPGLGKLTNFPTKVAKQIPAVEHLAAPEVMRLKPPDSRSYPYERTYSGLGFRVQFKLEPEFAWGLLLYSSTRS